jgi:hypothetical protein
VPAGALAVPAVEESVTVAVQVKGCPTLSGLVHVTTVVVVRGLTVIAVELALLSLVKCVESPPYVPMTFALPDVVPVNVAVQLADAVVPICVRVHGEPVKEPEAVPVAVNVTVPVGAVGFVGAVEVTVAVQVEA